VDVVAVAAYRLCAGGRCVRGGGSRGVDRTDGVPAVVVGHVRGVLQLPDGVVAETDANRTAKRYRQFVRDYLGVRYEAAKVRAVAEQAIAVAVQTSLGLCWVTTRYRSSRSSGTSPTWDRSRSHRTRSRHMSTT
jgi:hypothetical protein